MGTKKFLIVFGLGIIAGLFLLSIMRTLGLPTFETFLTSVFGEGNIWALVFSALLILLIIIDLFKVVRKTDENI